MAFFTFTQLYGLYLIFFIVSYYQNRTNVEKRTFPVFETLIKEDVELKMGGETNLCLEQILDLRMPLDIDNYYFEDVSTQALGSHTGRLVVKKGDTSVGVLFDYTVIP